MRLFVVLAAALGVCLFVGGAPVFAAQPDCSILASRDTPGNPIIENANASIERAIAQAQHLAASTPQDVDVIIARLLEKVDRIVDRTVHVMRGVEIEFGYVEVQIGDRTILVDPMKVAGG